MAPPPLFDRECHCDTETRTHRQQGATAMDRIAPDPFPFFRRQAARHSGPINWVLNHFRTVVRRVEYSDPYGQGEGFAALWHVATCRKCGLTKRSIHPVDITLFDIEHTQHPHDDTEVKAA